MAMVLAAALLVATALLAAVTTSSAIPRAAGHLVDPQDIKKTIFKQVFRLVEFFVFFPVLDLLDLSSARLVCRTQEKI